MSGLAESNTLPTERSRCCRVTIRDLEIISDGVVTVFFENLGLQLREKSNPRYLEEQSGVYVSPRSEGALMNEADITTFALDSLSKCFGPEYAVYDGRTVHD